MKIRILILAMALAGTGCSLAEPYIYDRTAYDRDAPLYGKDPRMISGVTICYSKYATKPDKVLQMARDRCGAYGLGVQFRATTYTLCPLTTPVAAQFDCVDANGNIPVVDAKGNPVAQTATAPKDQGARTAPQYQEGERPLGILFGRPYPSVQQR